MLPYTIFFFFHGHIFTCSHNIQKGPQKSFYNTVFFAVLVTWVCRVLNSGQTPQASLSVHGSGPWHMLAFEIIFNAIYGKWMERNNWCISFISILINTWLKWNGILVRLVLGMCLTAVIYMWVSVLAGWWPAANVLALLVLRTYPNVIVALPLPVSQEGVRSRPEPFFLIVLLNPVNLPCSLVPSCVTWTTADSLLGLIAPRCCAQVVWTQRRSWSTHTRHIPHHDNKDSTAVRTDFWIITDRARLSPSGPSTPPEELQLSALDSSSVLVSWRPPLEPNGIIIGYFILYSGNLSQPDELWETLSQDGESSSLRWNTRLTWP